MLGLLCAWLVWLFELSSAAGVIFIIKRKCKLLIMEDSAVSVGLWLEAQGILDTSHEGWSEQHFVCLMCLMRLSPILNCLKHPLHWNGSVGSVATNFLLLIAGAGRMIICQGCCGLCAGGKA